MRNDLNFTIVVPVYNREKLVVRTLDSIAAQTLHPLRLIIVDNNSSDDSLVVVTRWAESHRASNFIVDILTETTPGASAARNRGLTEVTTPYVVFFDSDDTMAPDLLAGYDEGFGLHPEAEIIYTGARMHLLNGKIKNTRQPGKNLMRQQIYHSVLRTQGYAVRTDYLRRCGGWNETLPAWNDWELGIRLLLPSPETAFLPGIHVDIYSQPVSITGDSFSRRSVNLERALDAASSDIAASSHPDRESLLRLVDYRRVNLACLYRSEGARDKAQALYTSVMRHNRSRAARILFPFIYHFTSIILRGASRIVDPFL